MTRLSLLLSRGARVPLLPGKSGKLASLVSVASLPLLLASVSSWQFLPSVKLVTLARSPLLPGKSEQLVTLASKRDQLSTP